MCIRDRYGTGSSRDWAAKGTMLLGVKVVIAKSFERIHRSNLIGMGVLPVEFERGQDAASLGLTGTEVFEVDGIAAGLAPKKRLTVRTGFDRLLGRDPTLRGAVELASRAAGTDCSVLILGETGTGKELLARAVHRASPRRKNAFVAVNCAAIPDTLLETELFGHVRGAFTGATAPRSGRFAAASGGTLFLDEVGDLPLSAQAKLLRVLEQRAVCPVGSDTEVAVDVRIVAATHRDLRAQVRAGRFREDLFYRLCVVPVTIPPLRQRRGDVTALAEAFLSAAAPRGSGLAWSQEALARLEGYDWPGNVRQLRNVVQRALLFRGEGLTVPAAAVVFEDTRTSAGDTGDDDTLFVRGLTMEEIEREAIRLSLRRHAGSRAAAVKELQLAKSTVMKRIAQWGLQLEGRAGGAPPDDEA